MWLRSGCVIAAMVVGTAMGHVPAVRTALGSLHVGATNIPIAIALIVMMIAQLAETPRATSLAVDVVLAPLVLFAVTVLFLHDHPQFLAGVSLIAVGRCVRPGRAIVGRAVLCGLIAWLLLDVLAPRAGVNGSTIHVRPATVARGIGLYVGVPLAVALAIRSVAVRRRGQAWYASPLLPWTRPVAPIALTLAILMLFAINGRAIVDHPRELPLVVMPLFIFWAIVARSDAAVAVAIAVGLFGVSHGAPVAAAIGAAVEGPIRIILARLLGRRYADAHA